MKKLLITFAALALLLPGLALSQTRIPSAVEAPFGLVPSEYVNSVSLAASTAETIPVPADAMYVLFSATCNFYANYSTTATVPGDVTNGSASELNPSQRRLSLGSTRIAAISVISPTTCVITASFYRPPN